MGAIPSCDPEILTANGKKKRCALRNLDDFCTPSAQWEVINFW